MEKTEVLQAWSDATRSRIEKALETAYAARPATEVVRAARYVTLGGGHRWRSLMAVAAGMVFRKNAETCALPLAAALEMMHAASLVLDDLPSMDNAATRRGKACVHVVFPQWVVDLLPAYLVNLAYHVAAENPTVPAECLVRSLTLLGQMGEDLARGQELDLALAGRKATAEEWLECYALKSGSLFAAALAGGALLCGGNDAAAQNFRRAGIQLGQAYQILDDIADGPEEGSEYKGAGRCTTYSLWGAGDARRRAENLLAQVDTMLGRYGPASGRLQELLNQVAGFLA